MAVLTLRGTLRPQPNFEATFNSVSWAPSQAPVDRVWSTGPLTEGTVPKYGLYCPGIPVVDAAHRGHVALAGLSTSKRSSCSSPFLSSSICLCSRCPGLVWRHCLRGGKVRSGFSSVLGRVIKGCSETLNFDPVCGFWGSFANPETTDRATPSAEFAVHGFSGSIFSSMHQGEERTQDSGGVWSSQFQTCHRLGDRFLSRPPARRSGSGRSFERGNASRPPARRSTRWQRWRLMRQP